MSYNKILTEEKDNTVKITLNRPEKRNSLDEEMISELTDAFGKFSDDKKTRSIILTGSGGNFCSGLYLDYLQKISEYDILKTKPTRRNSGTCFSPFITAASRS
ncbi:MAG: enoyl-CoA hydratase/isomerase family protein [Ignavibacteria bacterium]|nr:enoyl-CoA hydratase/isomerase family protein [Ignavibacteria bacterium]